MFSEGAISECSGSLRLAQHHHAVGSTTSSVVAEAASAAGADHADAASLDGRLSLADSEAEPRGQGFEWVEAGEGMALDVAPVPGRIVVMLSGAVDHALLAPSALGPGASDLVYLRAWCS